MALQGPDTQTAGKLTPCYYCYSTPYGSLTIAIGRTGIQAIVLGKQRFSSSYEPSSLSNEAATQILEYLAGKRRAFELKLELKGSDFQLEVWQAVQKIPYGESRTCQEVAASINKPQSFRAVGSALRKSPLCLLIPTHRVVKANGKALGSGNTAELEAALLRLERKTLEEGN